MAEICFLDGGLGQEIQTRANAAPHPLWSLKVMYDEPDVVSAVHRDFIAAGARVITANTYTASPSRLRRDGDVSQLEDIHKTALRLARTAIDEAGDHTVQLAGCLPPLVGSYVAEVSMNFDDSLRDYQQLVALQAGDVDLFLIETMSNITEALAALSAVKHAGKAGFVGLTVSDDGANTLRSGEALEDALDQLLALGPDGIMVNCSVPEAVSAAMPLLAWLPIAYGGYANGFTSIDALRPGGTVASLTARTDLGPEAYADFALSWVDAGARIIGGCCEVGPAHIAHLAERLQAQGHRLTGLPVQGGSSQGVRMV